MTIHNTSLSIPSVDVSKRSGTLDISQFMIMEFWLHVVFYYTIISFVNPFTVVMAGKPPSANVPATAQPDRVTLGTAYVTLLYDDSFILGVRVLGKSLESTGTIR